MYAVSRPKCRESDATQPRAALLGPVHSFRQADGGGNNLQIPQLGKAGTPYARSVQGKWCNSPTSLPDPGVIFDTLMKARDVRFMLHIFRYSTESDIFSNANTTRPEFPV
jgi:hypothetical protein